MSIYNLLTSKEIKEKEYFNYWDTIEFICFKEIKKVPDINYRCTILAKIISNSEIIKKNKLYISDIIKTLYNNKKR